MYWLLRCLKSHKDCSLRPMPILPTRVIDVRGTFAGREPFLYESRPSERGWYCCLSYRWPPIVTVETKTDNLAAYRLGIPLALVSRTIHDAIRLTDAIGVQYLWVDALCIIQDSTEDWTKEAAQMGSIYANSTLTLAAVDVETASQRLSRKGPTRYMRNRGRWVY
jgi:hypothetical protein